MYQIKQNLLNLQGSIIQQNSNYSQTLVTPSLARVIQLSQAYGTQIGLGPNVNMYKDYIDIEAGIQDYDMTQVYVKNKAHLQGKHIQIRRVFHYQIPAIVRYFDPWAGSGMGTHTMLDQFGWGSMSPSVQFNVMPIYQDLLRMQAIQLNDTIRKSNYSFQLVGNKLRLFPVPLVPTKLWFEYIITEDKLNVNYTSLFNSASITSTTVTGSLSNESLTVYTDTYLSGSSLLQTSVVGGNISTYISGSITGNLSGSFSGILNSIEYSSSTNINNQFTQSVNISGSFNGLSYIYNFIGDIIGQITGSVYITNYTGTYTYISQSVGNAKDLVSDPSNAPYQIIPYNKINAPGKA